jgi:multisubunit Na+/H+ antiporter MnhB subunit
MIPADLLLAGILVAVGAAALAARGLRSAVVLFIVFGLLLALVWVRLAAPDVALAEAAIGAGVAGALLLESAARHDGAQRAARAGALAGAAAASGSLAVVLALAAFAVERPDAAAMRLAVARLAETEVSHPVTAVLLAYRAYDTLLEIAVLLAAVVAGLSLRPERETPMPAQRDPVLGRVAGATIPVAVLVAVYLLWAGATRTGGAFQAGATLAGAMLLARFAGFGGFLPPAARRAALWVGIAVFAAVGAGAGAAAGAVLAYPPGWGSALILAVESALTVSIATSLISLFGEEPV